MELVPDRVASMMSSLGSDQFGSDLLGLFDPELELTHCSAFERNGSEHAPRIFISASKHAAEHDACLQIAKQWTSGDYKIDPLLVDIEEQAGFSPNVYYADVPGAPHCTGVRARMVEQYYDRFGVGEEATYTMRDGEKLLTVTFFKRRGSSHLTSTQKEALRKISGLIVKSAHRHAQLTPELCATESAAGSLDAVQKLKIGNDVEWAQTRAEKLAKLRSALLMDASHLTVREAEICASIVMGYTVFAISLLLGISPNTVATHRKRAYSKLGLSSQTELFNVCLKYFL